MRAAVYHGYRDVRVESIDDPGPPGAHEVRLKVLRTAICGTDASEYWNGPRLIPIDRAHPGNGHRGPVVLGHEMVGVIETIGGAVAELRPGQRVVPGAGMWCGTCDRCLAGRTNLCDRYYTLGFQADGGLAEYVNAPARMCKAVPDALSDEVAAVAQPLAVALHAIKRGDGLPGQIAILIGVGGIGLFALTALQTVGLREIVVVDVDDARLARAAASGAHIVNPTRAHPAELVEELTDGAGAHLVVEASGAEPSLDLACSLVQRGGRIVLIGLQSAPRSLNFADLVLREVDLVTTVAHVCDSDLPDALDLLARSELGQAAVEQVIPLEAVVSDGLIPLAERRVAGKIVVAP